MPVCKAISLGLCSGESLLVSEIMLFPESELLEILSLRASTQEMLAVYSTGISFWGSPGWVIGGAAALGAMESVVADRKRERGLEILADATSKLVRLTEIGDFFSVSSIGGIERAQPHAWRATKNVPGTAVNLREMKFSDRAKFIIEHKVPRSEIAAGVTTADWERSFVHGGEDFISVRTEGDARAIRWSAVDSYSAIF